jgi:uncharacterized protein YozE (UPF0346 family)
MTTLEELFKTYKPKQGWKIMAKKSEHTGKYIASVFEDVVVSKYSKDVAEVSRLLIVEPDFNKYFLQLTPYLDKR